MRIPMVCVRSLNRLPVVLCLLVMMALLVVPCAADTAMQQYDQTDLRGGDYTSIPIDTPEPKICSNYCELDSRCIGTTYVKPDVQGQYAVCWLKDRAWTKQPNANTVSFIKMTMQELDQTDLSGADYYRVDWMPEMTAQWCSNYCLSKEPCLAATFVKAGTVQGPNPVCLLKKAGYDQYRHPAAISFQKIDPSTSFGSSNPTGGGSWESCIPSFEATPVSGPAPLTVTFTDTSPSSRSRAWNFDNAGDPESYVKNPTYTYTTPGVYSVELTIGCTLNLNTITKENLISVGEGTLAISSTPSGAAIYIDDVYKSVTPFTVTGLTPGDHTVRLTKAGYEEHTETVTATPGQTGRLSATLIPQAATAGSLSLTSNPGGARVTLDGSRSGTTPWVVPDVASGSHSLVFSLAGYQDATATVAVQGGDTATYHAVLQKETGSTTGTGSLSVASVPSGASVSLDGVIKGNTPTTIQGISPGSHALALSLPGYETYRRNVDVTAGETSSYVANLITTGSTTGVTSRPTGQWTDTYATYDDWDDDDNDDDMPGFLGIGAVTALVAVFLLVTKRSGR